MEFRKQYVGESKVDYIDYLMRALEKERAIVYSDNVENRNKELVEYKKSLYVEAMEIYHRLNDRIEKNSNITLKEEVLNSETTICTEEDSLLNEIEDSLEEVSKSSKLSRILKSSIFTRKTNQFWKTVSKKDESLDAVDEALLEETLDKEEDSIEELGEKVDLSVEKEDIKKIEEQPSVEVQEILSDSEEDSRLEIREESKELLDEIEDNLEEVSKSSKLSHVLKSNVFIRKIAQYWQQKKQTEEILDDIDDLLVQQDVESLDLDFINSKKKTFVEELEESKVEKLEEDHLEEQSSMDVSEIETFAPIVETKIIEEIEEDISSDVQEILSSSKEESFEKKKEDNSAEENEMFDDMESVLSDDSLSSTLYDEAYLKEKLIEFQNFFKMIQVIPGISDLINTYKIEMMNEEKDSELDQFDFSREEESLEKEVLKYNGYLEIVSQIPGVAEAIEIYNEFQSSEMDYSIDQSIEDRVTKSL